MLEWIFGPLAGFECRWALTRRWVFWFRLAACGLSCAVLLPVVWYWWIATQMQPGYMPGSLLRGCLITLQFLSVAIVLLLCPALLAGTLAGEKDRGALGLLLVTHATPREIVLSRWSSRLSQVAEIVLAGFPALVLTAVWCDVGVRGLVAIVALLAALAAGAGGITLAASASSLRGRDALLAVYLLWFILFLRASFTLSSSWPELDAWIEASNPIQGLSGLASGELTPATMRQLVLWPGVGLLGLALASWRLGRSSGVAGAAGNGDRRGRVPPLDERPMVWKELYIERSAVLGRAGRWIAALILAIVVGGSVICASLVSWYTWVDVETTDVDRWLFMLREWTSITGLLLSCLMQVVVGLRAAVGISSERERQTWDALLVSPLEGVEIVWAKLWGALYSLRWFAAAALFGWTVALLFGAMEWSRYLLLIGNTLAIAFFMAAVGIRTSLATSTSTRGMTLTAFCWLGAVVFFAVATTMLTLIAFFLLLLLNLLYPVGFGAAVLLPVLFGIVWQLIWLGLFVSVGYGLAIWTHRRFDRIVGRSAPEPGESVLPSIS